MVCRQVGGVCLSHPLLRQGPRRLKNAIILLDWIPSLSLLQYKNNEGRQETPELAQLTNDVGHQIWRLFAQGSPSRLTPAAMEGLMGCARLPVSDEVRRQLAGVSDQECEGFVQAICGSQTRWTGRHFVLLSLREAETLRFAIHSGEISGDTAIGLRSVESGVVVAASARFPDLDDLQLQAALQAFRLVDYQSVFSPAEAHLLLRCVRSNPASTRLRFYQQMSLGRRRRPANIRGTPLDMVMNLRSETELTRRSALRLFLQMAMHEGELAIKELFDMLDANGDCSMQVHELCAGLHRLGLLDASSDAAMHDTWLWLQAMATEGRNSIGMPEFARFLGESSMQDPPSTERPWVPPRPLLGLAEGAEPTQAMLDALEQLGLDEDSVNAEMTQQWRALDVARLKREAAAAEEHTALLRKYEAEEEREHGPNPKLDGTGLVFAFDRLNLPKGIEFHGQPDFQPEEDRDKNFLLLHELAYFWVKPIPIEGYSTAASQQAGITSDAPSALTPPAEPSERSELSKVDAAPAAEAASAAQEAESAPLLLQYTILLHVLLSSAPSTDVPLLTLPSRTDEEPPEIMLTKKMRVLPRLVKEELLQAAEGSVSVEPKQWECITVAVDCLFGKLSVYLNGELHLQVDDPSTLNLTSPFALSREEGIKFFTQTAKYGTDLSIRRVSIGGAYLSAEDVAAQHINLFAWRCEKESCGRLVGPGRKSCVYCKTKRSISAPEPKENPDPKTGVFTVVGTTFEREVLKQREYGGETANPGPVMVLFYRASKHSSWETDGLLSEWSRFASLLSSSIHTAATVLRICSFDIDENVPPRGVNIHSDVATPVLYNCVPPLADGAGDSSPIDAAPMSFKSKDEINEYAKTLSIQVEGLMGTHADRDGTYVFARGLVQGDLVLREAGQYRIIRIQRD